MTSKNKIPEGQIIVDVQNDGEVLINAILISITINIFYYVAF